VLRGGSWYNNPQNARAAYRNNNNPDNLNNNNGFRVVRAVHDSAFRSVNPRGRAWHEPAGGATRC
jgi:hypothetical protein